ncbi:transcriptional repressor [Bermanella marisrubri]|nr:transcriptional repressor [Bermanella marisrubri]
MTNSRVSNILNKAQEKCQLNGARLTPKRQAILQVLLMSPTPLSAYQVAEHYKQETDESMPPMSAYRILDFLASEELVHKLNSENKYIACSHIACDHQHEIPQFLICRNCRTVKEIGVPDSIIKNLGKHVDQAGFRLMNSQLELDCICAKCDNASKTNS